MVESILKLIFSPPDVPSGLLRSGMSGLVSVFQAVYYRGVWDGFIAGCLLTIIMTLRNRRNDR